MKHKIWYDEENLILFHEIIDIYMTQEAIDCGDEYSKYLHGKTYRQIIVNLSQSTKMESRETRKVTNESLNKALVSDICFVGANSATRMIAKVLMKLGNLKANSNFVATNEQAIEWIKSKR